MQLSYRGVRYEYNPASEAQPERSNSSVPGSPWRASELNQGTAIFKPSLVRCYRGVRYIPL